MRSQGTREAVVVHDVANVLGSRPDGWWRDRAGATERLLADLSRLAGAHVVGPHGEELRLRWLVGVVEGAARDVAAPEGLELRRAPAAGDDEIVTAAQEMVGVAEVLVVVTADRGLRERLPEGVLLAGPGWVRGLLDDVRARDAPEK